MYCFISKGITQRLRWKLPDGLIFCNPFQHLSLYSNQFTHNLNKLYIKIFPNNHSIYWWKPHENPCSSFRVYRAQTDRQTDRRGGGLCFIICIDLRIVDSETFHVLLENRAWRILWRPPGIDARTITSWWGQLIDFFSCQTRLKKFSLKKLRLA